MTTPVVSACIAGALVGLGYSLSPMTAWFGVAMVALFIGTGRGLHGSERTWVLGLLAAALVSRLLALAVLFLTTWRVDGSIAVLIPDEAYLAQQAQLMRLVALGDRLSVVEQLVVSDQYGDSSLNTVHAYLQLLLGEAPHGLRLLHVGLYLTACVMLHRVVRAAFGKVAALGGLAVVLFMPSLFVWSIAFLKETPSQFLTVLGVTGTILMVQSRPVLVRLLAAGIAVTAVLAIASVRPGAESVLGGGIVVGAIAAVLVRRPFLLAGAVVCCVVGGVLVAGRGPQVQQRAQALLVEAATSHIGYINTVGRNYKVLDAEFYERRVEGTVRPIDAARFTPAVTARYLIRGMSTFFLVPLPQQASSASIVAYLPEQLGWLLLAALSVIGIVAGLRIDATVTIVLASVILLGAAAIGISSGNIGTLIRHRGMVMVLLPWLASLGACQLLTWVRLRARRSRAAAAPLGRSHAAY